MTRSSPDSAMAPPADLAARIEIYLSDMPSDGQHSDAAGANCWELLEEAMNELRASLQPATATGGDAVAGDASHVRSALETLSDPLLIKVAGVGADRLLNLVNRMRDIAATALLHLPDEAAKARKWDEGEHEGCGIDSQRALERQSARSSAGIDDALAGKVERIARMMRKLLADLPFCDPDIKDLEHAAAALRSRPLAQPSNRPPKGD